MTPLVRRYLAHFALAFMFISCIFRAYFMHISCVCHQFSFAAVGSMDAMSLEKMLHATQAHRNATLKIAF